MSKPIPSRPIEYDLDFEDEVDDDYDPWDDELEPIVAEHAESD